MFTRHFNPHQLSAAVQTISRRELTWDDNDSNGLELDVTKDDALAKLDSLLKRSLNTSYTFEDIETPRKRRKVEGLLPEEAESKAEAVYFRLLSSSNAAKSVILAPKPPPEIIPFEHKCEDNEEEAAARKDKACVCAVDAPIIVLQGAMSSASARKSQALIATLVAPSDTKPVFALLSHPVLQKQRKALTSNPSAKPCPHEPHLSSVGSICPQLSIKTPQGPKLSAAQSRRRRACRLVEARTPALVPTFFRPQPEWGGKSAGYAWGYAASAPRREKNNGDVNQKPAARPRGYERDKMKKGVSAEGVVQRNWGVHQGTSS